MVVSRDGMLTQINLKATGKVNLKCPVQLLFEHWLHVVCHVTVIHCMCHNRMMPA